jgi:hypothetical protein
MNNRKTYYPNRNGGDSKYKVVVLKTKIIITDLENEKTHEIKKYKKIFIGKNSKKYGLYDKPYTGSSILVEVGESEYIYICDKIVKFNTKEPITKFYSIMGNNFVVYPFALTESYAYLLIESIYIVRDFGDLDPYEVYYDFKKIWNRKSHKFSSKKVLLKN